MCPKEVETIPPARRRLVHDERSVELYLRALSGSESNPLSSAEEVSLIQKIHAGNRAAWEMLLVANLRFVVSVAKYYQNQGVLLSDLISAGNLGLITAVKRFDATKGFKFISYAVWWIRQGILQELATQGRPVRLPVNRLDELRWINELIKEAGGEKMDEGDIAEAMDKTVDHVRETLLLARTVLSLDMPLHEGEENTLLDTLAVDQPEPDAALCDDSLKKLIEENLGSLSPREVEVLRLYFGLGDEPGMILEEIGLRLNLTRERIRQIKERALRKLREPRRMGKWRHELTTGELPPEKKPTMKLCLQEEDPNRYTKSEMLRVRRGNLKEAATAWGYFGSRSSAVKLYQRGVRTAAELMALCDQFGGARAVFEHFGLPVGMGSEMVHVLIVNHLQKHAPNLPPLLTAIMKHKENHRHFKHGKENDL